jgi:hypothetical protein
MQTLSHKIVEQAKGLSETDKTGLDIDAVWAEEAQKRWRAYREGKIETVPYAEVMRKYKKA